MAKYHKETQASVHYDKYTSESHRVLQYMLLQSRLFDQPVS